jgi:hypothetical protein
VCRLLSLWAMLLLAGGAGDRSWRGFAMFLNVIVHSTSSPAKTVDSRQCTETLIFEDMVPYVDVVSRPR